MQENKELASLCEAFTKLLLEKNKRYGNSALEPVKVFSGKSEARSSVERLVVRLDEKLARVRHADALRTNDVVDVAGYCLLLLSAMGVDAETIAVLVD